MNYEYKTCEIFDAPELNTPEAGKTTWKVSCTSGIVGDTYNFNRVDNIDVVTDDSLTITEVIAEIETACQNYVTTTYPS
jgi:lipopolysaccharide export system protein LptC